MKVARYKHYDYDQLMMVPVSLEEQLMPGTLEYAIHHVVEERLDLSIFDGVSRKVTEKLNGQAKMLKSKKALERFFYRI